MKKSPQYAGNCRLLENYLSFLSYFRGSVHIQDQHIEVLSDRQEFKMLFPLMSLPKVKLSSYSGSVISLPWIEDAEDSIKESSLSKVGEIVFMSKAINPSTAHSSEQSSEQSSAQLKFGKSQTDLKTFSSIQVRGFLETEALARGWHPWLHSANLRNLENEKCKFLLAAVNDEPSAVTLLVEAKDSCGIYAVATPPEHRKKGLCTFLLNESEKLAQKAGHQDICLQVNANSYAHSLYTKLGFHEDYRIGVWKR